MCQPPPHTGMDADIRGDGDTRVHAYTYLCCGTRPPHQPCAGGALAAHLGVDVQSADARAALGRRIAAMVRQCCIFVNHKKTKTKATKSKTTDLTLLWWYRSKTAMSMHFAPRSATPAARFVFRR